jgi:hypothetical protein
MLVAISRKARIGNRRSAIGALDRYDGNSPGRGHHQRNCVEDHSGTVIGDTDATSRSLTRRRLPDMRREELALRTHTLIVVPCHRVVASDGGLIGYSGRAGPQAFLLDLKRPRGPVLGQLF